VDWGVEVAKAISFPERLEQFFPTYFIPQSKYKMITCVKDFGKDE
jgi:hypothetical protein